MSFDTALDYLNAYHAQRALAHNSMAKTPWCTSGATSFAVLFDGSFNTDADNTVWEELYGVGGPGSDVLKLAGIRKKIAFGNPENPPGRYHYHARPDVF